MVAITSPEFKQNARGALANPGLQKALALSKPQFMARRARAVDDLPEFEELREIGRTIKNHALTHLDFYLEAYADNVEASGGHVHWCATADDARAAVLKICQDAGARTVTKGKSMISEELGINEHLEQAGITPVETDLGEYIIQLRHEHPSHIIAPAFHLNREDWEETFRASHTDLDPDRVFHERRDILAEARGKLRERFLAADVGITGANFLIAETGSSVIVTNEGNGDLTQTLPKIHIVLASIEKCVPTIEDATSLLRLLARSATRTGFFRLHHVQHGGAAARRFGRAGAIPCRAGRWRALGDDGDRVPGDAALHTLRRLHEPLPGLWRGRRPRLWLGVSRADGLGADTLADRRRQGRTIAECQHVLRQMRERLPGEDPAAEDDAALARTRVRTASQPGRGPRQSRPLGLGRPAPGAVSPGDPSRGRRAGRAGPAQGPVYQPALGPGLDRRAGFPGARGRDLLRPLRPSAKGRAMSRDAVLGAIRRGLKRGPLPAEIQTALRDGMALHGRRLIPQRTQIPRPQQVAMFAAFIAREFGTVTRVPNEAAVPAALADYLAIQNLPSAAVIAPHPELRAIPWGDRPLLQLREGRAQPTDLVSVQHGFAGIAETGTIMLPSAPERPTTINLLADTAVVVLRASRVVGPYEDAWDMLRAAGPMPRNVMLVTGPSRSADIEQTLELGAHGPRRLFVILIDDDAAALA